MSETVRRCLGCSATYPADASVCPECGSCAAEAEEATPAKAKRPPRRKS